jgi:predicted transcriptional regulator
MEKRKVRRILVADREQHPVGVISEGDIAAKTDGKVSELVQAVVS